VCIVLCSQFQGSNIFDLFKYRNRTFICDVFSCVFILFYNFIVNPVGSCRFVLVTIITGLFPTILYVFCNTVKRQHTVLVVCCYSRQTISCNVLALSNCVSVCGLPGSSRPYVQVS